MRTDTIQEPTVVTDDDSTTGKGFKTFLQRTQRVHVNIIGWLVEKQDVALLLQSDSQVKTVTLTTGKHTTFLLLISTAKIETTQISSNINVASAHAYCFVTLAHNLINTLLRVDILMLLVNV